MNTVSRICIDMRHVMRGLDMRVEARWLPITLDGNKALTPNGPPSDWELVEFCDE